MLAYLARRLLLIIPTLLGILALNFFIIQVAPGGPVEQMLAKIQGFLDRGAQKHFVAVGALHLAGPRGLVARLRAAGYQVKQL